MSMSDNRSQLSGSLSFLEHQRLILEDLVCDIFPRKDNLILVYIREQSLLVKFKIEDSFMSIKVTKLIIRDCL